MFIAETWLAEARLKNFLRKLNFEDMHVVSKINQGGGLVLLWKTDLLLRVDSSSLNHIDVIIDEGRENSWRFIGFYGAPETYNRHVSWNLLRSLNSKFNLPWLCEGNFNEILKSYEKVGARPRPLVQMQGFRNVLDEYGFMDMGFVGNKFTWNKNIARGVTVWERLDRVVANDDWASLFPASKVYHLECGCSDHKPIIIHPLGIPIRHQKPWRFKQVWLQEEDCHEAVNSTRTSTHLDSSPMV